MTGYYELTVGRKRDNPPADAEQIMSRLDFRQPPQSEEGWTEEPQSEEEWTEELPSEEEWTEEPPRGAPEWLRSELEAERARREIEEREAKEAEERASADVERRIQELRSRIQEHHSFKQRFAETERRLRQRLGRVEARVQTAQRQAAWAERVAGLNADEPGQERRAEEAEVELRDDGQSDSGIEPPESAAEDSHDGNLQRASSE
jgi:dTMP kinase